MNFELYHLLNIELCHKIEKNYISSIETSDYILYDEVIDTLTILSKARQEEQCMMNTEIVLKEESIQTELTDNAINQTFSDYGSLKLMYDEIQLNNIENINQIKELEENNKILKIKLNKNKNKYENKIEELEDKIKYIIKEKKKLEGKLVDVESFLQSERGQVMQQYERDLAEIRLELANTQCEKDELEIQLAQYIDLIEKNDQENYDITNKQQQYNTKNNRKSWFL